MTVATAVKALALIKQWSGDELRQRFEEAVRITYDDDAVVIHCTGAHGGQGIGLRRK